MHSKTILVAAGVVALASAAEIDRDDIPTPCQQVCYPLVSLAAQCDRDNSSDRAERDCICNAQGTSEQLPICDACVRQYDTDSDDDDDDGDVADLRRECNFPRLATFSGPTGTTILAPLTGSGIATAGPLTSISTTLTAGGSTQTTVVVAGATTTPTNNVATLSATTANQQNAAATGKPLAGAAAAGVLAAIAAMA